MTLVRIRIDKRVLSLHDNARVPRTTNWRRKTSAVVTAFLLATTLPLHAASAPDALAEALKGTQASAVVIDQRTGRILAEAGAQRASLPGSAIKPLLLAYALEHGIAHADTEVYCRRDLHVAGRALPCTHPADRPVFTAERALAESCNTWFADLGKRFTGPDLEAALKHWHVPHPLLSRAGPEQRQLVVLGLKDVTLSPLQMAGAYRLMLSQLTAGSVVLRGLRGSVDYGMAHASAIAGVNILGKTGTASNPGESWTHGWFAGAIPGQIVVVIYVPHSDGGTAAGIARIFLAAFAKSGR